MASSDRSLYTICDLEEAARRNNIEIQKLMNEEAAANHLKFYKSLSRRMFRSSRLLLCSLPIAMNTALLLVRHPCRNALGLFMRHLSSRELQPARTQNHRQGSSFKSPADCHHVLAPNLHGVNTGRDFSGSTRPRNVQPTPRDMPDRSESKNPWINGILIWS